MASTASLARLAHDGEASEQQLGQPGQPMTAAAAAHPLHVLPSTAAVTPPGSMSDSVEEPAVRQRQPLSWPPLTPPIVLHLILWSGLGYLARLGLLRLHSYPQSPVAAILYPQVVGCLIMGWIDRNKPALAARCPNLLVGLSTGLCGSITTFSSFSLAAYLEFAGADRLGRLPGDNVLAGLAIIGLTIGMSVSAATAGSQLPDLVPLLDLSLLPPSQLPRHAQPVSFSKWLIPLAACLAVYAVALGTTLGSPAVYAPSIAIGLVVAPIGSATRYLLSRYNTMLPGFPIGTFAANTAGTALLYALYVSRSSTGAVSTPLACATLVALSDGFCGCLTTISTFTMEIMKLDVRPSYLYTATSVGVSQLLGLLIVGSWTLSLGGIQGGQCQP
ncbi:CrcB-like protein-domain-containing protein [Entophlyctis helioformis]|nr:CrcB-like protein-domain-containing protein [Entophlyctis helioformis]